MEKFDQRDAIYELNFGYRYNAKTVVCIYELEFGYTEVIRNKAKGFKS